MCQWNGWMTPSVCSLSSVRLPFVAIKNHWNRTSTTSVFRAVFSAAPITPTHRSITIVLPSPLNYVTPRSWAHVNFIRTRSTHATHNTRRISHQSLLLIFVDLEVLLRKVVKFLRVVTCSICCWFSLFSVFRNSILLCLLFVGRRFL